MKKLFLLLILLTGCATTAPKVIVASGFGQLDDHEPCIGAIISEVDVSYTIFRYNLILARDILNRRGILPADKFCTTFATVDIRVRDLPYWFGTDGNGSQAYIWGEYEPGTIYLSRSGRSMLHEMMHHLERLRGKYNPEHRGWVDSGYRDADLEFKNRFWRLNE